MQFGERLVNHSDLVDGKHHEIRARGTDPTSATVRFLWGCEDDRQRSRTSTQPRLALFEGHSLDCRLFHQAELGFSDIAAGDGGHPDGRSGLL